jgi:hypothetical protein
VYGLEEAPSTERHVAVRAVPVVAAQVDFEGKICETIISLHRFKG